MMWMRLWVLSMDVDTCTYISHPLSVALGSSTSLVLLSSLVLCIITQATSPPNSPEVIDGVAVPVASSSSQSEMSTYSRSASDHVVEPVDVLDPFSSPIPPTTDHPMDGPFPGSLSSGDTVVPPPPIARTRNHPAGVNARGGGQYLSDPIADLHPGAATLPPPSI